jgi:hypothetical protein
MYILLSCQGGYQYPMMTIIQVHIILCRYPTMIDTMLQDDPITIREVIIRTSSIQYIAIPCWQFQHTPSTDFIDSTHTNHQFSF